MLKKSADHVLTKKVLHLRNTQASTTRMDLLDEVFVNMASQSRGKSNASILLSGDPGVGKTSFVRTLAQLLGLNLVLLEVPHLTEEHIIDLPYLKFNPADGETKSVVVAPDPKKLKKEPDLEFELVLAESQLYSTLKNLPQITDKAYLRYLYNRADAAVALQMYESLGGTKTVIPQRIKEARTSYSTILFLDEYFRNTSTPIRNMLRGILNRVIGMQKLPSYVYPIYASNLDDEGLDRMPSNTQFGVVNMGAPDKDEWFTWFEAHAKSRPVEIDPEVLSSLKAVIAPEHLSHTDPDSGVRTSPRRWEQLIFYINSSFPIKNKLGARALLTNVKENFTDHLTGKISALAGPILETVCTLIQKKNGITVSPSDILSPVRWADTLKHQIVRKFKLGEARKYIPVVSGPPGLGKTEVIKSIAEQLGTGLIYIDSSSLSKEDVLGTPLSARTDTPGVVETVFSKSKLYLTIMKMYAAIPQEEADKGVIIFFDELNRTKIEVFNGLRKILLEKTFEDGSKLPPKNVIIGAINPVDEGGGITELTKHMSDIMDIITSQPSWAQFTEWLTTSTKINLRNPEVGTFMVYAITHFTEKFQITDNERKFDPHFVLNLGLGSESYISPRELTQIYSEGSLALDSDLGEMMDSLDWTAIDPDDQENLAIIDHNMRFTTFKRFRALLLGIFAREGVDNDKFMEDVQNWFMLDPDMSPLNELVSFKTAKVSLKSLIDFALQNHIYPSDSTELISFMRNDGADASGLKTELFTYLNDISEEKLGERIYEYRTYSKGKFTTTATKISLFSFVMNELILLVESAGLGDGLFESLTSMLSDYVATKSDNVELARTLLNEIVSYLSVHYVS